MKEKKFIILYKYFINKVEYIQSLKFFLLIFEVNNLIKDKFIKFFLLLMNLYKFNL